MNPNEIPAEIRVMKRWVCTINGSKIPWMSTIERAASTTDPRTWGTFEDAVNAVNRDEFDGVGFIFADDGIIGIDIDAGFNEDGTLTDMALDIIQTCNSYTERSRSGRGFHILLRGAMEISGRNNRKGLEIYRSGRYFITTGDRFTKETRIRHNQKAIEMILDNYFPEVREETERKRFNKLYKPIWVKPSAGRIPIKPYYPEIGKGCRNVSLLSLGGNLIQSGWDKEEVLYEMLRCNKVACHPPLDESEVRSVWKSVCRYERK